MVFKINSPELLQGLAERFKKKNYADLMWNSIPSI